MKVTFVFRAVSGEGFSIEEVFNGIIKNLPQKIEQEVFICNKKDSLLKTWQKIRNTRADVIHITGGVNYIAILPFLGKKVLTIHDLGHYKNLKGLRKLFYGLLWFRLPLLYADQVTCISHFTLQDIVRFFPNHASKVNVIPNPAPAAFKLSPKTFNSDCPRVLQVGTGPHKNLPVVIEALTGINCILVVIGILDQSLKDLLEHSKVNYLNFSNLTQEEVYEQYQLADIVTFVSLHEGFGMPILEAQSVGRLIITTAICSLPEVTQNSTPTLKNPSDATQLRAIIQHLISNESARNQYIERGKENIKRFDIEAITSNYLNLYQKLLS